MRKVVIYIAMSLDGYIAQKNGRVDFLSGDGSDENNMGTFFEFYSKVSDVIMGYKTYHQVTTELAPDNYPYKGKNSYVFTGKDIKDEKDIFFIKDSVENLIKKLKQNDDNGYIWINGGASIVNEVIKNKLFDEIIVSIIPTVLGDGIRLFNESEIETKLKFEESFLNNGIVEIKYTPR